jgi:hypothetical protein
MTYAEARRRGALAMHKKYPKAAVKMGRKGGKRTLQLRGIKHFRTIGRVSGHANWHVKRRKFSSDCDLCLAEINLERN